MATYGNLFELLAERFPGDRSRTALETASGRTYSYDALETWSGRFAAHLAALGVSPGERVLVMVDKSVEAVMLYLACLRAGFVYLPVNPAYQAGEVGYFIADAAPAAVVCRPEAYAMMRELAPKISVETLDARGGGSLVERSRALGDEFSPTAPGGDEPAAILYTSGTTGRPKGAVLSHANLASNALVLSRLWGFSESDVLLHALPIFHVHGLFVACHCALLSGARMLFLPRFEAAAVVRALARATVFMGVPTYYARLLASAELSREASAGMRLFISGSAPLSEEAFRRFAERTGHEILERYGMTETGMLTSNPLAGPRMPGSVGVALPGVRVRVADEADRPVAPGLVGQVQASGENVFRGYWKRPEADAEAFTDDGFVRTGDLGRLDERGYLWLAGRARELIITGGLNVYPKEVELAIDRIEGVAESAVFGLPDPDFGEAVTAAVVRGADARTLCAEKILARLKGELANYKLPKRIVFVDELPRNAMGKVQKHLLAQRCTAAGSAAY